MPLKDGLLAEFDHEMATTRKVLERLPDDKLPWKPHAKSMSMGALGAHISSLPHWGAVVLNEPAFDLAAGTPRLPERASASEMLAAFDEAVRRTRAAMDRTDGEYLAMWSLRRNGQEIFSMPRIGAFRTFVLYHLVHHRAQLTVYLRLNDIPVPPIYGPTADEG